MDLGFLIDVNLPEQKKEQNLIHYVLIGRFSTCEKRVYIHIHGDYNDDESKLNIYTHIFMCMTS